MSSSFFVLSEKDNFSQNEKLLSDFADLTVINDLERLD